MIRGSFWGRGGGGVGPLRISDPRTTYHTVDSQLVFVPSLTILGLDFFNILWCKNYGSVVADL